MPPPTLPASAHQHIGDDHNAVRQLLQPGGLVPIYEYECDACGHNFELLIRGGAEAACPACESARVTKRLSLPKVKSRVTQQKAMRAAKQRDRRMNAEQTRARIEYESSHDD